MIFCTYVVKVLGTSKTHNEIINIFVSVYMNQLMAKTHNEIINIFMSVNMNQLMVKTCCWVNQVNNINDFI